MQHTAAVSGLIVLTAGYGIAGDAHEQYEQSAAHANAATWHGPAANGHGLARYALLGLLLCVYKSSKVC